jgi:hypothetical protein
MTIQGFFLFDKPPFEYPGDSSFRLFENPQEGGGEFFLVDPPCSLTHLEFVDTLEVGVEEVVKGFEDKRRRSPGRSGPGRRRGGPQPIVLRTTSPFSARRRHYRFYGTDGPGEAHTSLSGAS